MRLSVSYVLLAACILLSSACHKTTTTKSSEATNNSLTGDWRMIQLNGRPPIPE